MSGLDIRDRSREVLVLKSLPYKEQDRLLTLLSPEQGVERAIARGAAKANSSLRPIAQAYTQASLLLSPAKGGISFVREGTPLRCFLPLDAGLERFAYGAYFSELALSVAQPEQPAEGIYGLLLAAWTLLRLDERPERTSRFFELRLLEDQGLLPPLRECSACGAAVFGRAAGQHPYFLLSPSQGQLLCRDCLELSGETGPSLARLSPGAVQAAQRLLELPLSRIPSLGISPLQNRELAQALAAYLDYHLEYAPKARRVLEQLKK